jgi:ubiquinol-cytochrome c reductase cytochrome c subunit
VPAERTAPWLGLLAALAVLLAAPSAGAQSPELVDEGRQLYAEDCISCHGPEGEGVDPAQPHRGAGGVTGAGPPLLDVGPAALDFYLSTGRMPLSDPDEPPRRGEPKYDRHQLDALIAYLSSLGPGGEPIPEGEPERGDVRRGLELFTTYCAGCHQVVAEGGMVTGAVAPGLFQATPTQIAEAVRIGPYVMPSFDEGAIDDQELNDLVRYVEYARAPEDPGGWALGHIGPIPEGAVAWLLAGGALVLVAFLIGERARR